MRRIVVLAVLSSTALLPGLGSAHAGDPAPVCSVHVPSSEGTTAWGALYHRGMIYVGDMTRGLDVFEYTG